MNAEGIATARGEKFIGKVGGPGNQQRRQQEVQCQYQGAGTGEAVKVFVLSSSAAVEHRTLRLAR